ELGTALVVLQGQELYAGRPKYRLPSIEVGEVQRSFARDVDAAPAEADLEAFPELRQPPLPVSDALRRGDEMPPMRREALDVRPQPPRQSAGRRMIVEGLACQRMRRLLLWNYPCSGKAPCKQWLQLGHAFDHAEFRRFDHFAIHAGKQDFVA